MPNVNRVLKTKPLNFVLYYQNYVNLFTIYLDDGYEAKPLYLDIFNESEYEIQLAAPGTDDERRTKEGCHFYLTVPKGILALDGSESLTSDNDWQVKYVAASKGGGRRRGNPNDTLYFSRNTPHTIAAASSQDQELSEISLILNNIQGNSAVELRSSDVRLYYGRLTTYKEPIDSALAGISLANQGYNHTLSIVNHLGKKNIPLHASFAGSNTILNDGGTANELQLQITNIQDSNNPRPNLAIGKRSRFIISFESGELDKEWALGTANQVGEISIVPDNTGDWQVDKTDNKNEWILTPKLTNDIPNNASLTPGEAIALNISNIQSNHPSGQTKLTIHYEEIPDYWDGDLVCLIEKTPLMYRSPLKATANNQVLTAVRIKTNFDDDGKLGVKHVGLAVESGNVGIGTTNPTEKLEVAGNVKVRDNLQIENGNVGIGVANPQAHLHIRGRLGLEPTSTTRTWSDKQWNINVDDDGNLAFHPRFINRSNPDPAIFMTKKGYVGICNTSPTESLDVVGNIKFGAGQIGSNYAYGPTNMKQTAYFSSVRCGNGTDYALSQNSSGRTLLNAPENQSIMFRINNKDKMTLNSSGNLGIGTIFPSTKLEVNGTIRASSVINTSDQRLKQDIEPVSNILKKVMELQPKSYRWLNSESDSGKLLGFIAQDVESIFPDCVDNKSNLKALNYNDFTVMAIAAIQEQQKAIQEQQKLINALQEEVAQLKQ